MDLAEVRRRMAGDDRVFDEARPLIGDAKGTQLRFAAGEIVNVYETGTIDVQGKDQERVRALLGLTGDAADVERRVGLLTEIRDLQREQLGRFDRLLMMYEQVLAGQQQSVGAYQGLLRRLRPFLITAGGLILVILLLMLWLVLRMGARYG